MLDEPAEEQIRTSANAFAGQPAAQGFRPVNPEGRFKAGYPGSYRAKPGIAQQAAKSHSARASVRKALAGYVQDRKKEKTKIPA
jgi:hypothetical protein